MRIRTIFLKNLITYPLVHWEGALHDGLFGAFSWQYLLALALGEEYVAALSLQDAFMPTVK